MAGMMYTICRNCLLNSKNTGMIVDGSLGKHAFLIKHCVQTVSTIRNVSGSVSAEVEEEICKGEKYNDDNLRIETEMSNPSHSTRTRPFPAFVKLGDSSTLLSKAMLSVTSKRSRKKGREILLEGSRLINDAIKFGVVPKMVFFSRIQDAEKVEWPSTNFDMYKITYKTLQMWSNVTTSPGVLGIFEKPEIKTGEVNEDGMPLILVCDNIRDPGNLGATLRVAAASGCKCVVLTKGCVELWDPKVLRSASGAHFALPIHSDCSWEEISKTYLDDESTVILADNCSSSLQGHVKPTALDKDDLQMEQYHSIDYSGAWNMDSKVVLVLGGETEGLSEEACNLARSRGGVRLNIPLHNGVESLNVSTATGIIVFEIRHQYDEWCKRSEQKLVAEASAD